EKKVLADRDPEDLHQMRVELRRLETALQVFDRVVELPKSIRGKRLQTLMRVLGKLRDLDVQIAELNDRYAPTLSDLERPVLKTAHKALRKYRAQAFSRVQQVLSSSAHAQFKADWDAWLQHPTYQPLATLPLGSLIPDLLSPLLSRLLLHPAWLIALADISDANSHLFHQLRKACKRVRYQAEFFLEFYGDEFRAWIAEIKAVQSNLGTLHDCQVLQTQLAQVLPKTGVPAGLCQAITDGQTTAMTNWDVLRQRYLHPSWRSYLRQLVLQPASPSDKHLQTNP
ncbi:MAG: CHAD domain-containing protein, partial [Cyanobacteria bacterium]|nr:CHAD domain-containing protein [Cyanobacteriota bacterium]MDW8203146.1 CHAD domain-containing protein [Cyanobacteriota bacterium SKYGB_h_bin112]